MRFSGDVSNFINFDTSSETLVYQGFRMETARVKGFKGLVWRILTLRLSTLSQQTP